MDPAHQFNFEKEDAMKVSLLQDFKAEATTKDGKKINGTWSTLYDQAFRVELEDGNRYLANFRYNIQPSISKNPLEEGASKFEGTKTDDYASF